MAEAVQELFPGTQVTIGPSIDDGFYYDFARAEPFSLDDLAKIEQRMKEIVDRDETITREVWSRDEAIAHFKSIGELYKAEIIEGIPAGEDVSVYRQGNWKDLCRGPHLPSTKFVGKAFKLTKLAATPIGAATTAIRCSSGSTALPGRQRPNSKPICIASKRLKSGDHRKDWAGDGDLFHLQEEAKGMIFWHPKGWTLYRTVEAYMRRAGWTPMATSRSRNAPDHGSSSCGRSLATGEKFGKAMFTCETGGRGRSSP